MALLLPFKVVIERLSGAGGCGGPDPPGGENRCQRAARRPLCTDSELACPPAGSRVRGQPLCGEPSQHARDGRKKSF